ncbi:ABC transporter ATP-binding protein [Thermochromatium tepidum]|uniref:ATP-binding cassette domain-containing protein n=1 Tax=Thermochromatium tepidum ATCC 43061 TaxID=316276 RepID=A0A6I6E2K8_THETI|nr:ABC transporter ATP-binding protein [Thermochromatium tepidum]QGU31942.1 ATP-binding cassette domain-containing protein [Thermochromatium tepidum ATCC 43061]
METLVFATNLSRDFGRHPALSNLDLCLERGQVLGLLGPNGAGKTTCLRLLSGLLAPSSGRIEILGIDLARRPLAAKRHLGYLPERPPLYPELRVDEYLTHCAQLHRLPRRAIPAAIATAKQRCGLEDQGRRLIAKLSRGYRQRLGLAQAILHRPPLLILDEPTEGLDPVQMRELRQLIRDLAQDTGIILSSHLLPEVQSVCDRVMILHRGRVRFDAETRAARPTNLWRVRLGGETHIMHLTALDPVAGAIAIGPNRFQVELREGSNSSDLARAILRSGLELFELVPERTDLERTFFDLIGAEEHA